MKKNPGRQLRFVLPFSTRNLRAGLAMAALFSCCANALAEPALNVVGKWKLVSHVSTMDGKPFDSQAALLQHKPCASQITYNVNPDGTYRVDASASTCDEKYKKMQERLYAATKWKLQGNRLTTGSADFSVGQTYTVTLAGSRMTWVGTEGQGTMVFQK